VKKFIFMSLCMLLAAPSVSQAIPDHNVAPGYDLFVTDDSSTDLLGIPLEGVPIGLFDFGGTTGVKNTDDVDTIIQRTDDASVAGDGLTDTIDIELVALQLVSTVQFDLDGAGPAPFGYYYITLQSGQSSTGTMDIAFDNKDGGTFDSDFTVYYDLRFGGLDGTIFDSNSFAMTSSDNSWSRIAPDIGAVVIDNVNYDLKGDGTTDWDFWPGSDPLDPGGIPDAVSHDDATGVGHHVVRTPEPATIALLGLGYLLLRRRKKG
jgi:hypothetical protein